NVAIRCWARYASNAWRMLVAQIAMPRPTRALGRWQIVAGGTATETQVAYLTDSESRMLAARGGGGPGVLGGAVPDSETRSDRASTRDVPEDVPQTGDSGTPADPLSEPLTLREAVAQGVLPWSVDATKKRLQRTQQRPTPVGKQGLADLYARADLVEWAERET